YGTFMHVQHAAGRGGPGAVFGSKHLKAVAVRGSGGVSVGMPTGEYIVACKALHDIIMENPVRPAFRWAGTTGMLPVVNESVGLPYRNHQDDKAPDVSPIHNDEIAKYVKRYEACSGCNVICGSVVEFERQGRKYRSERIEHESVWALGPNCGTVDLPAIMEANYLCDHLGLDTMSAGSAIAWAMEMTEKGLLTREDTDGLDFSFGNADVLREAVLKISARDGFGDLLAQGSRGAARKLGKGEEYAMQVKGLDLSAYAPRAFTGMGISFATTARGADHNKAFTVAAEFLGVLGDYDRYDLEGKAHLVKTMQDSTAIIDSLIMCMFTVDLGISVELYARCASLPTGMTITADDVYAMGGKPLTAMNLVFFPSCIISTEVLAEILAGGMDKIREAGACLVGGHTVEDDELKYGLSVTGTVDPSKILRNCTATPGDVLILTKPLGVGIVSTGIKAEMASTTLVKESCRWMTQLNSTAAALMLECSSHACKKPGRQEKRFAVIYHSILYAGESDKEKW
ncbi:MAG: selenide, water dikinase SelD, partial [bacterium]